MPLDSQHAQLQIDHLHANLKQTTQDLADALREVEQMRQLIIGLGQAFVPEAFAALSATNEDERTQRLKTMSAGEIVALMMRTLGEKIAKLTAFKTGLTPEQQARWIQRVLETDAADWASDPQFAEMRLAVEQERAARLAAENAAHDAEARAQQVEARQGESATELLRLRGEVETLQAQVQAARLVAVRSASPPAQMLSPTVSSNPPSDSDTGAVDTSELYRDSVTRGPESSSVPFSAESPSVPHRGSPAFAEAGVPYAQTVRDCMEVLILVLATRGLCERPRLAEILHSEYKFGDSPDHYLINQAFEKAIVDEIIEPVKPRTESGVGRASHLFRLKEKGHTHARKILKVEPVPSELDRLLKRHDTPEHVALILQARSLFLERYPDPVKEVELFPAPVQLAGGKRSEPDLTVNLADGRLLLVECERDTVKNEAQRADKWAKYYAATHGEFFVVCPNPKTVSALATEINLWHIKHGGRVHLRVTSVNQVLSADDRSRFWAYDRTLG